MKSYPHKRILMLHSSSDLYGASKIFLISIQALKKYGFEIDVVLSEDGPLITEIEKEGVHVHIQKLGILRRKYFNISGLINRASTLFDAHSFLGKLIESRKIDIVYSNTSAVLVGGWIAKKHNLPHVTHLHEIIESPSWLRRFLGRVINKHADLVLAVSQAVTDSWVENIHPSKIKLLYNGIPHQPYHQITSKINQELPKESEGKILIGMIARVNHWKGQHYFIDIAVQLSKSENNLHFIIVGDAYPGTEHFVDNLLRKIARSGIEEKISYLGYRSDIPEILNTLDIFILPSILPDPLPTTVLEAMAAAKPVIATDIGGAREMVVEGDTGVFIPYDNAVIAAQRILPIVQNPKLIRQMGLKGQIRQKSMFSEDAYVDNFAKAILKVCKH
ncbi:glycosyltransferase family 4 protein [Belliella kenyensis]|uniref:Glycosyltransferase family 4 protein n=1 Tax=Belliella kenyensis TaxID=1472724 RepID=A0ABV8EQG5_9BACT|nr:glycosyltransferase family 4 protein [Belliella kenyensis]MCH7401645.1 glycosyltransferase family 4 protein [Belliella kenyensis]MDN3603077.1 glycosyltransferase family 4 protein [Belliella kenyensis]